MSQSLPHFRFHPDPQRSGSVVAAEVTCDACGLTRSAKYVGPIYVDGDTEPTLCPWCIAEGTAHARFGAVFQDASFPGNTDPALIAEIEERTPGFATFNPLEWPVCCTLPMAYGEPTGIAEIRARYRTLEGQLMATIVHELGISGGAARTFLESLRREESPTVHVFHCLSCDTLQGQVDQV
jgi:uncharacterized protein CbrC (UPF0167 family)